MAAQQRQVDERQHVVDRVVVLGDAERPAQLRPVGARVGVGHLTDHFGRHAGLHLAPVEGPRLDRVGVSVVVESRALDEGSIRQPCVDDLAPSCWPERCQCPRRAQPICRRTVRSRCVEGRRRTAGRRGACPPARDERRSDAPRGRSSPTARSRRSLRSPCRTTFRRPPRTLPPDRRRWERVKFGCTNRCCSCPSPPGRTSAPRKFISLVAFEQLNMPKALGPLRSTARRKPAAARSSASSHVAARNTPFSRTNGSVNREYVPCGPSRHVGIVNQPPCPKAYSPIRHGWRRTGQTGDSVPRNRGGTMAGSPGQPTIDIPPIISVDDHVVEPPDLWSSRLPAEVQRHRPPSGLQADGPTDPRGWRLHRSAGHRGRADRMVVLRGPQVLGEAAHRRGGLLARRDRSRRHHLRRDAPRLLATQGPTGRHGRQQRRGVVVLPQLPPLLRATLQERKGQRPGAAVRAGLQRLDGRRMVRRLEWSSHPVVFDPAVGCRSRRQGDLPQRSRGVRAVAFSECPAWIDLPSIHSGYWEPFWAACAATGTVPCMHIGSGTKTMVTSSDAPEVSPPPASSPTARCR